MSTASITTQHGGTRTTIEATIAGVDATLAERGDRYGDFTGHAEIAQSLMDVMRDAKQRPMDGRFCGPGSAWNKLSFVQRQSLTVIADKIARILNGDPNYKDNWHDIQGYAKLAEDRCAGPEAPASAAYPNGPDKPPVFK